MKLFHEDIRDSLVQAGQKACGYMNCKLFVQTVTGIPKLDDLPSRSFRSVSDLTAGDVLKWGTGQHWAIYIGDGDIMEVEEWGAESRTVPLAEVLEEMDPPDMVFSTDVPQQEGLLREYIRGLLIEDTGKRKQFAQHLSDAGHTEENFEPTDIVGQSADKVRANVKTSLNQGALLKKAFAKTADRAFLDSLVTVHWFRNKKTMEAFIDGSFSSKDELSTSAYLPGQVKGAGKFGDYGILVKGHITLLANDMDQLYTGASSTYDAVFPERKKQSGVNKGVEQIYEPAGYEDHKIVVLDEEDWDPKIMGSAGPTNNEALVDNWSPMAIIVPDSSYTADVWDEDLQKTEPAGPDTAEAEIVWQPLLDKAGLDIPVLTHKEFTSRGWV